MKYILCLFLIHAIAVNAAADSAKNMVLILADDLGWADTTLYGKTSLYETPNIEQLLVPAFGNLLRYSLVIPGFDSESASACC